MINNDEVLKDVISFVNMKLSEKMNFIACNNERTMNMLNYFVNITKDRCKFNNNYMNRRTTK